MSSENMHFPSIKHYHVQYTKHLQFIQPTQLPSSPHNLPPLHQIRLTPMSTPPTLPHYTGHMGFVFGYPIAVTLLGVMFMISLGLACTIYIHRKARSKQTERARRRENAQHIAMLPQ